MKKIVFIVPIVLLVVFISSLFLIPKQNNNDGSNNNNTSSVVSFTNMKYLAFGDSITAGSGLSSKDYSYPSVVAKTLGTTIRNKGVGGSTIGYDTEDTDRHCIADDIVEFCGDDYKADIISFTGGSNDKGRSIPLGDISDKNTFSVYGALNIIAKTLTEKYPNAFIFFMTPIKNPTCEVVNSQNYTLKDICIAIKEVASIYDIPVLDLYNTSQYESADCGMYADGSDGWHPNQQFVAEYLAPQISQFIKDNYNK